MLWVTHPNLSTGMFLGVGRKQEEIHVNMQRLHSVLNVVSKLIHSNGPPASCVVPFVVACKICFCHLKTPGVFGVQKAKAVDEAHYVIRYREQMRFWEIDAIRLHNSTLSLRPTVLMIYIWLNKCFYSCINTVFGHLSHPGITLILMTGCKQCQRCFIPTGAIHLSSSSGS